MRSRPTNSNDMIDSRDVEEAITELESELETAAEDGMLAELEAEQEELTALLALREQGKDYGDWQYGATLIADHYFETYARELADDLGLIKSGESWPYTCIDWERAASELQTDYTSVEFDGVTYWIR